MCWDSDINWSGLENQRLTLEKRRERLESFSPTLCQEDRNHWGSDGAFSVELTDTKFTHPSEISNPVVYTFRRKNSTR